MPTYTHNGNTNTVYWVVDLAGRIKSVAPGDSIQTLQDLSSNSDMTEDQATPTLTLDIDTADTWTYGVRPGGPDGHLNISVSGSGWTATVTLQRSFDGGTTWHDVATYSANTEADLQDPDPNVRYRIGVKSGELDSGTVTVRLSTQLVREPHEPIA